MTVSGVVNAKCKECKCVFDWHFDNMPFIDSEIIGTCSKCIQKDSHDCVDENELDSEGVFKIVGRKEFKEGG